MHYVPRTELVRRLLQPRSVALIGVSPEPGSMGGLVLNNLTRFGYRGDIHLVSRSKREIGGRPCVSSIDELPEGIDAAVLAVPAAAIREAVLSCGQRKVATAVIFAAGFAEVGGEGEAMQKAMVEAARIAGPALAGPNCIGYTNFADSIPLTFEPTSPSATGGGPSIGVVAQSGAMQTTLRLSLQAKGVPVSYAVSTGNEADLGAEDFLSFLIEDEATRVIVLFAEQFRHPMGFLALAKRARNAGKPIVLMHPGRSARAQESARSHTGAMTGDYDVMRTLVAREGVLLVETLEELTDCAEILLRFPKPPVLGVGIVTNSGAFKGYALDFCDGMGLDLPVLSPGTVDKVKAFLPAFAALENPLDVTAQSLRDPAILGKSAQALLADDRIGSAVVAVIPGNPQMVIERAGHIMAGFTDKAKPLAVSFFGDESPLPPETAQIVRDRGACFIKSPDRALRAMARVTAYGQSIQSAGRISEVDAPRVMLKRTGTLAEYEGKKILEALGIPVPRGELARKIDDAKAIASRIGYPAVLKAQAAGLPHKSDAGGVVVGIADEAALGEAWERLHSNVRKARPELQLDGVLVEAMGERGIEMVVGARRDPSWGPVLMVGLGGIWIETLKDVRVLAPDLPLELVLQEILRLRGAALLKGTRGSVPADVNALAQVIVRLGAFVRAEPRITEMDINPLVVHADGRGVTALDALVIIKGSDHGFQL
jgi:acetate---CoA ligase (ADP-forming)